MLLEKFLGDLREERVAENILISRIEETFVDELGFELVESFSLGVFNRAVVDNLVSDFEGVDLSALVGGNLSVVLFEKFLGDLREERVAQNVLVSRIEETFVDELGFELVESFSLGVFD